MITARKLMIFAPLSSKWLLLPQGCGLGFSCSLQRSRDIREEVESAAGLDGVDRGAEGRIVVGAGRMCLVGVDVGHTGGSSHYSGGVERALHQELVEVARARHSAVISADFPWLGGILGYLAARDPRKH